MSLPRFFGAAVSIVKLGCQLLRNFPPSAFVRTFVRSFLRLSARFRTCTHTHTHTHTVESRPLLPDYRLTFVTRFVADSRPSTLKNQTVPEITIRFEFLFSFFFFFFCRIFIRERGNCSNVEIYIFETF